jgi:hypothetical protein
LQAAGALVSVNSFAAGDALGAIEGHVRLQMRNKVFLRQHHFPKTTSTPRNAGKGAERHCT